MKFGDIVLSMLIGLGIAQLVLFGMGQYMLAIIIFFGMLFGFVFIATIFDYDGKMRRLK